MIDAGLVPAGPGAARRELRRPILRPARPMALGGAINVAGVVGTAAAVRFVGRVGRAAPT